MSERLRDLMEQASAQAPVVRVREDTWRRARRTRAAELVVLPVLVIAVLALVGLSMSSLVGGSSRFAPAAGINGPGLPRQLYEVPSWVEPSEDLDVGALSVVWSANGRRGVTGVRADDGAYVALELPGFEAGAQIMADWPRDVALSPDGTQLAYSTGQESDLGHRLSVLDLETGEVTAYLEDERIAEVDQLTWDDVGGHVAYRALVYREDGATFGPGFWESIDVASGRRTPWQVPAFEQAAMGEDGASVVHADGRRVYRVTADGRSTLVGRTPAGFVWQADGVVLDGPTGVVLLGGNGICWWPEGSSARFYRSGNPQVHRTMLAVTDETATTLRAVDGNGYALDTGPFDDLNRPEGRTSYDGENSIFSMSVAEGLTELERQDVPEPNWPVNPRIYWIVGLLSVVAGLVGWLWLTRRKA